MFLRVDNFRNYDFMLTRIEETNLNIHMENNIHFYSYGVMDSLNLNVRFEVLTKLSVKSVTISLLILYKENKNEETLSLSMASRKRSRGSSVY